MIRNALKSGKVLGLALLLAGALPVGAYASSTDEPMQAPAVKAVKIQAQDVYLSQEPAA
ncbi:hypothetical protein ABDI30_14495 [Paenibacillus cisolokensis]|uniref:hypothetical protein n=1 Tax=Paenibacillus cisolokensis TaxID=1658519 RepID=UPI003D2820C6